jgi:hypothetical protein
VKYSRILGVFAIIGSLSVPYSLHAAEAHNNIILHTDAFKDVAQKFADFHKSAEGANSILVSVDALNKKPRTSKLRPPHPGFETTKPEGFEIKNYNYDLALKIADFLRDYGDKNPLHSVMILGNATLVHHPISSITIMKKIYPRLPMSLNIHLGLDRTIIMARLILQLNIVGPLDVLRLKRLSKQNIILRN